MARSYFVRQGWPIAAGLAFAFVLGWFAHRGDTPKPASAGVTVMTPAYAAQAKPAPRRAVKAQPKLVARRVQRPVADDGDEVVVRHYNGQQVAQQQKQKGVKTYSDLN